MLENPQEAPKTRKCVALSRLVEFVGALPCQLVVELLTHTSKYLVATKGP